MFIIPYQQLDPGTLQSVLQEYASRDGTDYGALEYSLDEKVAQLLARLKSQELVLCFDPDSESCNVMLSQDAKALMS
ncbi:MAG: YheU family protein [Pseudomonadales bacterium]|nr:YheU family protein [Pseudomonadales bacterium]